MSSLPSTLLNTTDIESLLGCSPQFLYKLFISWHSKLYPFHSSLYYFWLAFFAKLKALWVVKGQYFGHSPLNHQDLAEHLTHRKTPNILCWINKQMTPVRKFEWIWQHTFYFSRYITLMSLSRWQKRKTSNLGQDPGIFDHSREFIFSGEIVNL